MIGSSPNDVVDVKPTIFMVCQGQDDNLGDVVLRRRQLECLQELGRVRVLVGGLSSGFVEALRLNRHDIAEWSFRRFVLALAAAVIRSTLRRGRPVVFAFHPGELVLTTKTALVYTIYLPLMVLTRIGRGSVIHAGSGIREWRARRSLPLRVIARLATVCTWRDTASAECVGAGDVVPDWAFATGTREPHSAASARSAGSDTRDLLTLSIRSDTPEPSTEWCEGVAKAASESGVQLIVVSQVRRDDAGAVRLARRLGCPSSIWGLQTHLQSEQRVRQTYQRSVGVVSDRLHALILGCVEGAVPIGAIDGATGKIARLLEASDLGDFSTDVAGYSSAETTSFILQQLGRTDDAARSATMAMTEVDLLTRRIVTGCRQHDRRLAS